MGLVDAAELRALLREGNALARLELGAMARACVPIWPLTVFMVPG